MSKSSERAVQIVPGFSRESLSKYSSFGSGFLYSGFCSDEGKVGIEFFLDGRDIRAGKLFCVDFGRVDAAEVFG